jgi:hypothetical protein
VRGSLLHLGDVTSGLGASNGGLLGSGSGLVGLHLLSGSIRSGRLGLGGLSLLDVLEGSTNDSTLDLDDLSGLLLLDGLVSGLLVKTSVRVEV